MKTQSTLLVRFSVIGVLITLLAAATLGYFMQRELTRDALVEAGALAATQVTAGASPHLQASDISTPLSESRIRELDVLVTGDLMNLGSVVRIKIWRPDGTIVFSDDTTLIGQRFAVGADLSAALRGELVASISDLSQDENLAERERYSRLLEAYVPLRLQGSDEIVGAYEVYSTLDRLDERIARIRQTVALGVFGGFAILYLALFGVVYRASRRLVQQSADNARLADEIALAYNETIEGWSSALDLRDKETEGHSKRVTEMTVAVARVMGIPEDEIADIHRGALLHDIGKMGVPDSILLKPGPLDDAEWERMREHPGYAKQMLERVGYLGKALDIPYSHHEYWDGTGYPQGLRGEDIPLPARIFTIVDVWDALSSDRPYRPAWDPARVRRELLAQSGKQFDPSIVPVFLSVLDGLGPDAATSRLSDIDAATAAAAR